jgi:hypothetical protein
MNQSFNQNESPQKKIVLLFYEQKSFLVNKKTVPVTKKQKKKEGSIKIFHFIKN